MKKTILFTTFLLVLHITSWCQSHTREENIQIQAANVQKGNWFLGCLIPTTAFEIYETRLNSGHSFDFNVMGGYFFANRYCLSANLSLDSYWDGNKNAIDKSFSLGARRYFLKRASLYFGLGCKTGYYNNIDDIGTVDSYGYIRPYVELGYEYLITELHPILNNHLGLEVSCSTMIPFSNDKSMEIDVFPAVKFRFGVLYHF